MRHLGLDDKADFVYAEEIILPNASRVGISLRDSEEAARNLIPLT